MARADGKDVTSGNTVFHNCIQVEAVGPLHRVSRLLAIPCVASHVYPVRAKCVHLSACRYLQRPLASIASLPTARFERSRGKVGCGMLTSNRAI